MARKKERFRRDGSGSLDFPRCCASGGMASTLGPFRAVEAHVASDKDEVRTLIAHTVEERLPIILEISPFAAQMRIRNLDYFEW